MTQRGSLGRIAAAAAVTLFTVATGGAAQHYHDEAYLAGGFQGATGASGIFVVRSDGSSSLVGRTWGECHGFTMDTDNRHVVAAIGAHPSSTTPPQYPANGIYRFDPGTRTFTTLYGPDPRLGQFTSGLTIDANGDYLFVSTPVGGPSYVMGLSQAGVLSTLFTSTSYRLTAPLARNILNGNLLVGAHPVTPVPCAMLEIQPGGVVTTFTTGGGIPGTCWDYGTYSGRFPQDHATGDAFGPSYCCMLRASPGQPTARLQRVNDGRTAPSQTPGFLGFLAFDFDLQSAASRRWAGFNHSWSSSFGYRQWIGHIDTRFVYTSIQIPSPTLIYDRDFDFYRGRHVQTVRTGARQWQIRIDCPRFPNLPYAIAAGVSGTSPAIPLRDGRRIRIAPDVLFGLTLGNRLPGVWNPGPGRLDASGRASAALDLRPVPKPQSVRVPLWISVVVLDPSAPNGIRYIPDTWVMQV